MLITVLQNSILVYTMEIVDKLHPGRFRKESESSHL